MSAPMMNSWFDHDLWNHLFLQLSTAEPSVCHAVIAVGALHEETQGSCDTIPSQGVPLNIPRRFALEQYGRAIAALNSRMGSNDFELKNTALHLDDQAVYFGKSNPRGFLKAPSINVDHQNPIALDTLAAAFRVRNCFLSTLSEFLAFCESLSSDNIARQWSILVVWQQHMRALLAELQSALDRLEAKIRHGNDDEERGLLKQKHKYAFKILRLHCGLFSLQTDLCLLWKRERVEDEVYTLRFHDIVDQCEAIAKTEYYHQQPSHLMEIGVIQPLYYVCERCADQRIVQRAMDALENWSHREGLWSSRLAIHMVESGN
ncbi:hypothetical protein UA08_02406 [Talaromyces atroroseus]|uniref:Uncharacterized protein n=1 Tax=Talaromyces atroroseus TaxID=1441469 RepID=A0A225B437_TALAT|nr:hypothetical protein UA08_02406 [Talaromyces atroroseus]OKL62046.1 hypothetical protein UA08_02406 [Talaromyces atroroseus]